MRKRLWDLAKSRIEIGTILPGHRHKVQVPGVIATVHKGAVQAQHRSSVAAAASSPLQRHRRTKHN